MITRIAQVKIAKLLQKFPAVAILGPRQVGKTTLARILAHEQQKEPIYLDLERPSDLIKLAEPELYLQSCSGRLVIMDEIQRLPALFQVLRSIIDERKWQGETSGQFLLLGSASLELLQNSAESLAGRIIYQELTGINALEIIHTTYTQDQLWLRGGFPQSLLAHSDIESLEWRYAFIKTYLERDIPQLGPKIPAETLRRLWTMLAHEQGGLLNASRLATSLSVSVPTVKRYLDLLNDLLLIRSLNPWANNIRKRLIKSPKIFIRDSGIVHALLGLRDINDLIAHPVVGGSWEGFIIENLLSILPAGFTPYFYRTAAGAEIDLIIEAGLKLRIAIEIKRSLSPKIEQGFYNGCEDIKATHRYVVYPGRERYQLTQQVIAIPLTELMQELQAMA